ncbi:hypothetical protein AB0C96_24200 [Streptomyces sp. NPDC048506]|uniref:hypothetical protein n=1 Tax=Streptomyces sp. NPDC048506 TaxID=3155028 RepID=UPI0034378405
MRVRYAAGIAAAASLFVLFGGPAAVADPGSPLVQSKANTGISVGGLLDIGASNTVNGTSADSGVKVQGPAGISSNVTYDTNVGVDILTDLAATVTAAVG